MCECVFACALPPVLDTPGAPLLTRRRGAKNVVEERWNVFFVFTVKPLRSREHPRSMRGVPWSKAVLLSA
jgi:hypothetical protein